MKSVKDVAETVNVSKTSIYNLIKKHSIPVLKREGKTLLDESSISLIIGYYSTEQHETISDILTDTHVSPEGTGRPGIQDSEHFEYTRLIGILEDERSEKNKVIKDLLQSNRVLSQALAADRVNEAARLMMKDGAYNAGVGSAKTSPSRGFFRRMFKKS